ncbi:hypothetical protein GCM10007036_07010 [Alsobacter metallidurans]|uniref:Uncharacterized protein n=1 Tax=Alsobacter metallidurans TaxID=340221 RepID=A0A917I510_9HYPH|nr:hypothetical protein [Alsobacter metallidurans]GGH10451.1 hypothetical protein GCM10007036_07010 [Alsobacter metallidurans]
MLDREWRGRFLKRLVRHVDETAERQKQIAAAKAADLEVPRKAAHEHARLFPYEVVEKHEEAAQRRGAMGRFPTPAKPPEPKKPLWVSKAKSGKPARPSGWQREKPR